MNLLFEMKNFKTKPEVIKRKTRGNTKDDLIQAAKALSLEKGLLGWSFPELAARVGIPKSNVYWHFPKKSELIDIMVDDNYTTTYDDLELEELQQFVLEMQCEIHRREGEKK